MLFQAGPLLFPITLDFSVCKNSSLKQACPNFIQPGATHSTSMQPSSHIPHAQNAVEAAFHPPLAVPTGQAAAEACGVRAAPLRLLVGQLYFMISVLNCLFK